MRYLVIPAVALLLAACNSQPDGELPGNLQDERPYAGIVESETIKLNGTEPFWGGEIKGGFFNYTTPEHMSGQRIAVERFAGRGGLSFSGELDGLAVDVMITPGECSDGMSYYVYPFTATLQVGDEQRNGCASTSRQPATGGE